ncbi:hypothetical protein GGD41_005483 [Paraburkholderia bryophila]|uniref:Uncharacterized protein n=1 Tax=Paraburkholderia bryophila TaxID=420952 RepID=A0A7Y9WDA8_9BURK|nr:hypothetical protein [Paraburkholderia bryophila]
MLACVVISSVGPALHLLGVDRQIVGDELRNAAARLVDELHGLVEQVLHARHVVLEMRDDAEREPGQRAHDHHRQKHHREPACPLARHVTLDARRDGMHELEHQQPGEQRAEQPQFDHRPHAEQHQRITADFDRRKFRQAHVASQPDRAWA